MRRRKLPQGMFGTEAELCDQLIKVARACGYQVHAEVSGWDLLIVCRETGTQLGVQAKLRPSVDVLAQALGHERLPGPELHAVLVPVAPPAFITVARRLNVHVIQGVLLGELSLPIIFGNKFRWTHTRREWVPEVEVYTPAGVPSPRSITRWKLAAVKLCMLARERGHVTAADLRELKLSRNWWFSPRFGPVLVSRVKIDEHGLSRAVRNEYVLRDPSSSAMPDLRWPEIVVALREPKPAVRKGPRLRVKRSRTGSVTAKIEGELAS